VQDRGLTGSVETEHNEACDGSKEKKSQHRFGLARIELQKAIMGLTELSFTNEALKQFPKCQAHYEKMRR
jgi:hypothetical protein